MKLSGQKNKYLKILLIKFHSSRLVKFTFIILIWIINLEMLNLIGFLSKIDGNLLIVVNLAVFFFALTASPTTWIVKGPFGFEAGSNNPKHTHITFNENSHDGQVDIREYGDKENTERLIRVSNELEKKV
jgi:hypothetical protein